MRLRFQPPAFGFQIGDDARQHRIIQTFAHHIVTRQSDVQAIIGDLVLRHRDINQLTPHLTEIGITALQFDDVVTRALGKRFIFVIMLFRIAVKSFEIRQRHVARVFLLLFFQPGDKHTELGTPVADVVSANNMMAQKLQRAYCRIADNRGA